MMAVMSLGLNHWHSVRDKLTLRGVK